MAMINIESNASDEEIECLRVAFNRHCPVLDDLGKSLHVELEVKPARKNKTSHHKKVKIPLYAI